MSDPRRWSDEGGPDGVKSLLHSARGDEPSAAQLARVMAKLGPLLVPSTAAAAASVTSGSGSGSAAAPVTAAKVATVAKVSLATKVIVAAVTVAAVGGIGFQGGRVYQERTTPPPAPTVIRVPVAAAPVPVPLVEPSAQVVAAAPAVVKPVVRQDTPEAEVTLLQQAMAAQAGGDSAKALTLTQQHSKRFAHGNLEQEREVIAIEALVQLGRLDEAKKRAEAFAKRFPTSSHLLKVESLVGQ